jgi:hypothetical protein
MNQTEKMLISSLCNPDIAERITAMMRGNSLTQLATMMDDASIAMVMNLLSFESRRSLTAQVIAHEIVHMWAGNMVSPKWWDALWLNEGFATLIPTLMFAEYHRDYEFLSLHDASTNQLALFLDSVDGTRPVHGQVISESDPFDLMSYNKGAIILGMLRRMVGSWKFQDAVRSYMQQWYRKSLDTSDLLTSLNTSLGIDLSHFFDCWIYKSGFPLVVVEDNTIRQMPFCGEGMTWPIPLRIRYGRMGHLETTDILLSEEMMELPLGADWMIVNPGCETFCRVWLVGDWFYAAVAAVMRGGLTTVEQLHFVTDQQVLYRRGFLSREEIVHMCTCLRMPFPG